MANNMHYSISLYQSPENIKYRIESHDNTAIASGDFHGWVLTAPTLGVPFIKLTKSDGTIENIHLSESRPDVINYFSKTPLLKNWNAYGFNLTLHESLEKVSLTTQEKLIFVLNKIDAIDNFKSVATSWSNALIVKKDNLKNLALKINSMREPYISIGPNAIQSSIYLNDEQKKSFSNLIRYLESDNFITDFISTPYKKISNVTSYFDYAICINSFYIKNINYICFMDSNGDVFYILQHFSSFDGLYYPKHNLFYAQDCISPAKDILTGLVDHIASYNHDIAKENQEYIYLCGHNRPYHFLYDNLLGLAILNRHVKYEKISVVVNGSGAFLPLSCVQSLNIKEQIVAKDEFEKIANGSNICFLIGMKYSYSQQNITAPILNDTDQSIASIINSENTFNLKGSKPLIWFGITSQKRQWLNQIDGITFLINSILHDYPDAAFIIDGWTSPLVKSPGDNKQIESDLSIFKQIKQKCNHANIFTTIGLNSLEKVTIGRNVDFFMANSSTGAVHIDRICRIPGISHGPNVWNNTDAIHISNAVKVDPSLITDINPEKYQDSVDYLIEIEGVTKFFKYQLKKTLQNQ